MTERALSSGTVEMVFIAEEPTYATNSARVLRIDPASESRECMLASEKALRAVWMAPEEDEAWKDL